MAQQARDDDGQFACSRDPGELLNAMDPLEPYATGELADLLDWPRRTTYKILDDLADAGEIRKKKPERSRVIWIRPADGAEVPA
jgi:DNA-binding MarR family transcriptional regulator